jgi:hypothetical protein
MPHVPSTFSSPTTVRPAAGAVVSLVAALLLAAPPAEAAPANGDKVAVLPLEVGPGIKAGRPALEAAVVKGLVQAPSPVQIGPEVANTLNKAGARVACSDAGCWKAAGRALNARHLVTGAIDRKGPNFEVEFRLVDAVQGRVLLTEVNQCKASDCSVAELCRLTVNELARAGLVHSASPLAASAPTGSTPANADSAAPPSPTPPTVAPPEAPSPDPLAAGAPPPDLDRAGSSIETDARPHSDLMASATPGAEARRWPRWVPIASIAAGVVAGGVGGFLIYMDGEAVKNARCQAEMRDGAQACRDVYNTFWGGITTAGVGAALVGTGIVMAIMDAGKGEPATEQATRVQISPTGVAISGRF